MSVSLLLIRCYGQVAQLVEHWTENPGVAGSTPALSTYDPAYRRCKLGFFMDLRRNSLWFKGLISDRLSDIIVR